MHIVRGGWVIGYNNYNYLLVPISVKLYINILIFLLSTHFLLNVLTGPPTVAFTWRHWGNFEGQYKQTPATGETIEMFGCCVAKVTDQLKIQSVDVYFDPNIMMATFTGCSGGKICPLSH
jgi:hypothetical protein